MLWRMLKITECSRYIRYSASYTIKSTIYTCL